MVDSVGGVWFFKVDFVKRCCGQSEQLICLHWATVAVVFLSFGSTAVSICGPVC